MLSDEIWCCVGLVKTEIPEECVVTHTIPLYTCVYLNDRQRFCTILGWLLRLPREVILMQEHEGIDARILLANVIKIQKK
jgi:hypothetical protein